ncbi:hypothetical protein J6TS7_44470 [Paenibacillus dendritiformis]|uniref:ORF6N domain-containing protein n=1 Tax=Paenibacillus TaxID=44249 RepID=UPI001B25FED1|nr:ORF6N domain-containing protein [Paenibacillus dendritiformis]GIO80837.1 hypothetical protein J6TS7_44470 [Paenibacillus dendritiformis]
MNKLQIIKHNSQRVLTTSKLAEAYGTDSRRISENFNRNKDRYVEGKHYFGLEGEEKREFLDRTQIEDGSKNAAVLYLWTEKGAWMHAKSLNTDQAWEAYEMLVDDYYSIKINTQALSPELQLFNQIFTSVARMELEQSKLQNDVLAVKQQLDNQNEILALNPIDGRKKVTALLNKIAQSLGGGSAYQDVRADSYKRLEERARCDLNRRVTNKKQRLSLEGIAKSTIGKITKLDVILDDGKLTEIYFAIVKEMAVENHIDLNSELKEVLA